MPPLVQPEYDEQGNPVYTSSTEQYAPAPPPPGPAQQPTAPYQPAPAPANVGLGGQDPAVPGDPVSPPLGERTHDTLNPLTLDWLGGLTGRYAEPSYEPVAPPTAYGLGSPTTAVPGDPTTPPARIVEDAGWLGPTPPRYGFNRPGNAPVTAAGWAAALGGAAAAPLPFFIYPDDYWERQGVPRVKNGVA